MPRYVDTGLNECTDPASGDWLQITDVSATGDQERKLSVANILAYNSLVVRLKNTGTTSLLHDGMSAGVNPVLRLHGTRTSGLTLQDTVRVLLSMSNLGNAATDYAAFEAAVDAFNGGGRLAFFTQPANGSLTERLRISSAGVVTVAALAGTGNRAVYSDATGNLTNTASDERLKTDIESITPVEALTIANALQPVRYNWRDRDERGEGREMGLIAQDVQAVAPEVVGENSDGMLSLDYAKLVAVLAGAVQALTARVQALTARVQALEAGRTNP